MVVSAAGYADLIFTGANRASYLNAISQVQVGQRRYEKTTSSFSFGDDKLHIENDGSSIPTFIWLALNGFSTADHTVVTIIADGYTLLTLTIIKDGALVAK